MLTFEDMPTDPLCDMDDGKDDDKTIRWQINPSALVMLNQVYALEPFPSTEVRKQLAVKLKAHPRQVQTWFQTRRARERRLGAAPRRRGVLRGRAAVVWERVAEEARRRPRRARGRFGGVEVPVDVCLAEVRREAHLGDVDGVERAVAAAAPLVES